MATELTVVKTQDGRLAPATDYDTQLLAKLKVGTAVKVKAVQLSSRSLAHHGLFFGGLIPLGMDYWEPKGGLMTPKERYILEKYVKYLGQYVGDSNILHESMEAFIEVVEDVRAERYPTTKKDANDFLEWLKMEVGHYNTLTTPSGPLRKTRSINFNSMDQESFSAFYDKCFSVIWRTVLQGKFENEEQAQNAIDNLLAMG